MCDSKRRIFSLFMLNVTVTIQSCKRSSLSAYSKWVLCGKQKKKQNTHNKSICGCYRACGAPTGPLHVYHDLLAAPHNAHPQPQCSLSCSHCLCLIKSCLSDFIYVQTLPHKEFLLNPPRSPSPFSASGLACCLVLMSTFLLTAI